MYSREANCHGSLRAQIHARNPDDVQFGSAPERSLLLALLLALDIISARWFFVSLVSAHTRSASSGILGRASKRSPAASPTFLWTFPATFSSWPSASRLDYSVRVLLLFDGTLRFWRAPSALSFRTVFRWTPSCLLAHI
jgi:hypothetical protein